MRLGDQAISLSPCTKAIPLIFLRIILLVSIVFPFLSLSETLTVFAHNEWDIRPETRAEVTNRANAFAGHGLTAAQLSNVDEFVAMAYNKSVDDGYKLGRGYSRLWFASLVLDALLFITGVIGLRLCRNLNRLTLPSGNLPPADVAGFE